MGDGMAIRRATRTMALAHRADKHRDTWRRQQRYTNEQYESDSQRGPQSNTTTHDEDSCEVCKLFLIYSSSQGGSRDNHFREQCRAIYSYYGPKVNEEFFSLW